MSARSPRLLRLRRRIARALTKLAAFVAAALLVACGWARATFGDAAITPANRCPAELADSIGGACATLDGARSPRPDAGEIDREGGITRP